MPVSEPTLFHYTRGFCPRSFSFKKGFGNVWKGCIKNCLHSTRYEKWIVLVIWPIFEPRWHINNFHTTELEKSLNLLFSLLESATKLFSHGRHDNNNSKRKRSQCMYIRSSLLLYLSDFHFTVIDIVIRYVDQSKLG